MIKMLDFPFAFKIVFDDSPPQIVISLLIFIADPFPSYVLLFKYIESPSLALSIKDCIELKSYISDSTETSSTTFAEICVSTEISSIEIFSEISVSLMELSSA